MEKGMNYVVVPAKMLQRTNLRTNVYSGGINRDEQSMHEAQVLILCEQGVFFLSSLPSASHKPMVYGIYSKQLEK